MKAEAPAVAEVAAEEPKAEEPKVEAPKVAEDKSEEDKAEEVKAEAPKAAAEYEDVKLPNIRKVIAKSMHASLSEMAQLTLNSSFDATNLLAYRAKLKANGEALGLSKITINDMVDDYAALRDAVALEILAEIADGKYVKYYDGELLFDDYRETIPEWMTRAVFFGEKSMTVVFGVYDIAAYAAGEQAFMIPYTLIAPYLNDYGKMELEIE